MRLTIEEAAARMRKSVRQIRYLIDHHQLKAHKEGSRWVVDLDVDLPPTTSAAAPRQGQATDNKPAERKAARLRKQVEDSLALPPPAARPSFSLRQLNAFQLSAPIYRDLCRVLGAGHQASGALQTALLWLARGYHRFDRGDKVRAYQEARDNASQACGLLLLTEEPAAQASPQPSLSSLVERLEQQLMPALGGLLRSLSPSPSRAAAHQ